MCKVHCYALSGFFPIDNDITKGDEGKKISFVRAGAMVNAKKDSYHRVNLSDNSGRYHYPQIPENILRKKGELYFENHEVTGSDEGTAKNPKFSLLKLFLEVEIPRLEAISRQYWSTFGKKLAIRFSLDGAGPHQCKTFLASVREAFEERHWTFVFQPPNSPICNTKDASIFPAMSKQLSNYQGVSNRSRGLTGEVLWRAAFRIWELLDERLVAKAWAAKHQITCAISECKGGGEFQRGKNAMHFGVRVHFIATARGVCSIESYDGQ